MMFRNPPNFSDTLVAIRGVSLAFLPNLTKELKCLLVDPPIVGIIYISYQNIIPADRLGIFNL